MPGFDQFNGLTKSCSGFKGALRANWDIVDNIPCLDPIAYFTSRSISHDRFSLVTESTLSTVVLSYPMPGWDYLCAMRNHIIHRVLAELELSDPAKSTARRTFGMTGISVSDAARETLRLAISVNPFNRLRIFCMVNTVAIWQHTAIVVALDCPSSTHFLHGEV